MLDSNLIIKDIYGKYHYSKLVNKEIENFLETMLTLCEEAEITLLNYNVAVVSIAT